MTSRSSTTRLEPASIPVDPRRCKTPCGCCAKNDSRMPTPMLSPNLPTTRGMQHPATDLRGGDRSCARVATRSRRARRSRSSRRIRSRANSPGHRCEQRDSEPQRCAHRARGDHGRAGDLEHLDGSSVSGASLAGRIGTPPAQQSPGRTGARCIDFACEPRHWPYHGRIARRSRRRPTASPVFVTALSPTTPSRA